MNNQDQKQQTNSVLMIVRCLLIVTGLVLLVVYGYQAGLQATSWQAVAGSRL